VHPDESAALLPILLRSAGLDPNAAREPIRVWARSGVERLRLPGGATVVFKYAQSPFDREHIALRAAGAAGLAVPEVLAAHTDGGLLGMLLEDLGEPLREAADQDGAEAAVHLHRVPGTGELTRLNAGALAQLPALLHKRAVRFELTEATLAAASALTAAAEDRAQGAERAPFGLCHSEFHPTSVLITADGWRLLDLARAFVGPGLLDLASWHGTIDAPDVARTAAFLETYVKAGGESLAVCDRGGLPAAQWALGWHRLWVAEWFSHQVALGWAQEDLPLWSTAIERHTLEAAELLAV
jgi:hypothetical protein